jgi:histidyl-tRNA synthetase
MKYQKPKGTRDIVGKELERIETVCNCARDFFKKNGYEEIRTPSFEFANLFIRSIGEHTDIVEKENYTFESNKKIYMLRPEGTASVLRALIENKMSVPARLLYIGSMFRKEKPQKGRFREFLQIGIELIGKGEPFYDAEMIDQGKKFLDALGAQQITIELNSIGCPQCRAAYKKKLKSYLKPSHDQLCEDCQRRIESNFLRVFDCKKELCQHIYNAAPKITDNLCEECVAHYMKVKYYLGVFGVHYTENKKMVRGLDYYTRTVFEFKDSSLGSQDTVLAGGRYDLLMKELGGSDSPALGWAMGVDRMLIALPENVPQIKTLPALFIATLGDERLSITKKMRNTIQAEGCVCYMGNPDDTVKQQLKAANKLDVNYVIIYGENEEKQGMCAMKNMQSGEQVMVSIDKLADSINRAV